MAWHANCYKSRKDDKFPVARLNTEDDEVEDPKEASRFKCARLGDNLMCPFQCEICHFRNIQLRDPRIDSIQDKYLLVVMRRAILDSFWARAEGTVLTQKRDVGKILNIAENKFGLRQILPDMGPYRLRDDWGMQLAVVMLDRSLDVGRNEVTLQFGTTRKLRAAYSNVWNASVHGSSHTVMARDTAKSYVTSNPAYSLWFERFVKGLHNRMGDNNRQDTAITGKLMKAIIRRVEADYHIASTQKARRFVARAGFVYLACYLKSLRGEEICRIITRSFLSLNIESQKCETPHIVLPMYGRFKNDGGLTRCYVFRICNVSRTGLDMKKWTDRLMELEKENKSQFLLSSELGKKETGGVYQPYLVQILKKVQRETRGLIPSTFDVEDNFGIGRSFRRGSVTEAGNAPNELCSDDDIKRNNRWRSEEKAETKSANLDMIHLYTDTLHSVAAELRFSSCL